MAVGRGTVGRGIRQWNFQRADHGKRCLRFFIRIEPGRRLPEVQLDAEVAALAPAEIKFKPAIFIVNERQI